jgi:hypothetical protein
VVLLRGDAPPPIPFLVDSAPRRRFAAEPGDAVLMAHAPEEGWAQLAYAGPQVRRMADEILAAAAVWERDDGTARFAYFADRHDHPDPAVRQLALTEISAAPYALIRTKQPRVSGEEIREVLRDPNRIPWAPIHILFLGLSDNPADRELLTAIEPRPHRYSPDRGLNGYPRRRLRPHGCAYSGDGRSR